MTVPFEFALFPGVVGLSLRILRTFSRTRGGQVAERLMIGVSGQRFLLSSVDS